MKEKSDAVRPATREAWHALIAEGKAPSVRSVYARVGGKYTRLVTECRILRQEGNGTGEAEGNGQKLERTEEIKVFQACQNQPPGAQQPTGKTYVCTRWPSLRIKRVKFRDGICATNDEDLQKMIEGSNWFGVFIHEMQG